MYRQKQSFDRFLGNKKLTDSCLKPASNLSFFQRGTLSDEARLPLRRARQSHGARSATPRTRPAECCYTRPGPRVLQNPSRAVGTDVERTSRMFLGGDGEISPPYKSRVRGGMRREPSLTDCNSLLTTQCGLQPLRWRILLHPPKEQMRSNGRPSSE